MCRSRKAPISTGKSQDFGKIKGLDSLASVGRMNTDEIMQATKLSLRVADGSSVDDGEKKSGMIANAETLEKQSTNTPALACVRGPLTINNKSKAFNSLNQSLKAQQILKILLALTNIAVLGVTVLFSQSYPEVIYYLGYLPSELVLQILSPVAVATCILMSSSIIAIRKRTGCQADIQTTSVAIATSAIPILLAIVIMPAIMHQTADKSLSQDVKLRMAYSLIRLNTDAAPKLLKSLAAKSNTSLNDLGTSRVLYANYLLMINAKRAHHQVEFRQHVDRIVEVLSKERSMPPLKLTGLTKQYLVLSRDSVAKSVVDYLKESNDPDRQKIIAQILKSTSRFETIRPGKHS